MTDSEKNIRGFLATNGQLLGHLTCKEADSAFQFAWGAASGHGRNETRMTALATLGPFLSDVVFREAMHDAKDLFPDNYETVRATEVLAKEGFIVLPYMNPDLNVARDLQNAGAAAVMPLAAPIGSNKGLATKAMIQVLIDEIDLPIIVDAGIGKPSQACEAMEMGAAAIMANTAIATAGDVPAMAEAFRLAIEAGRKAYLTGMGRVLARGGSASDPLTGFLGGN